MPTAAGPPISQRQPRFTREEQQWTPQTPFELLEAKLQQPRIGEQQVPRPALIELLSGSTGRPVVVIRAGPGYGKTTTLVLWSESEKQRQFAWVGADREDNDPVVLLTYVAVALDRITPLPQGVFDALASPGASIEAKVLPRLGEAIGRTRTLFVLVVDDAQAIENPQCIDALTALTEYLPAGCQLVFATRDDPILPLGRLRTRGLLSEIATDDLRMGEEESRALLSAEAVDASDDEVAELVRRTEGWPAGLYLAALSAKAAGSAPHHVGNLTGKDPFVVDFLRSELLAHLSPGELFLLTRTSMLERLSGPLCDAVLESSGSAETLDSLERSNRFVVSLDRDREWYRCHHLVREMLADELARSEPEAVNPLHVRAFEWCMADGQLAAAMSHGQAAGDVTRVAALMERAAQSVYNSGRTATVEQWFNWLETHSDLERHPAVAVIGAIFHAASGDTAEFDRWAAAAERGTREGALPDGSASIDSWKALLRAMCGRDGIETMREDAAVAVQTLAPASGWHPLATMYLGLSELVAGNSEQADDLFAGALEEARSLGALTVLHLALGERALIALNRGEYVRADTFAEHGVWATRRSRLEDSPPNALIYSVAARAANRCGRAAAAKALLDQANTLLPRLTYPLPILAVQARLEMARTYLELDDHAATRTMSREIDIILRRRPHLGSLPEQAAELRAQLSRTGDKPPGVSTLTPAELHVLPFLATHLTFPQVGERVHLSPYTIKSHVLSIYRKLGVKSRQEAVTRAREVGLLHAGGPTDDI